MSGLRSSWRPLALTAVAFKLLAFVVLTPLLGIMFRASIAMSGSAVLSDVDILFFLLGPAGWVCAVVVGGSWLGIVALEQAALLAICRARNGDVRLDVRGAIRFAAVHAWPVLRLTTRIVALVLLVTIPFLVALGATYLLLLTEFDINFYLREKPVEFRVALGIGVALGVVLLGTLLRLATSWVFALPIVLFEGLPASEALAASAERATGRRRRMVGWVVGWMGAVVLTSSLMTGLVVLLGRAIVPSFASSLFLLALAIGVILLLSGIANLAVNVLATMSLSVILSELYRVSASTDPNVPWTGAADRLDVEQSGGFTRGRLVAATIAGSLVALGVGVLAIRSVRLEDAVEVMGHRGAAAAAPENTLAAIDRAIDDGADWVEIDVQETADGEVVVFHDSDFMKLAGRDLKIWEATADDLRTIDIGSWYAPEFADQRVPTLDDVLERCKGRIGVNIELKYYGHDDRLEQRVSEIVDDHGMGDEVMFMSLSRQGIERLRAIRPEAKVGLLLSITAGDPRDFPFDFLAVNAAFASRRLVRRAHANGQEIYVWTVNDAASMSTMIGRGVDGLLTDEPGVARSVLEQRAALSPPERLLLELSGLFGVDPQRGEE